MYLLSNNQWLMDFYAALARDRAAKKPMAKHIPRKFRLVNNPGARDMFILDPEKKLEIRALAEEMRRKDEEMRRDDEEGNDDEPDGSVAYGLPSPTKSATSQTPSPTKKTVTYFNQAATELINREKELGTFSRFQAAATELKNGPFPPHIQAHKREYLHAAIESFLEGLYNKMGVRAIVVYGFKKDDGTIMVAEFVFQATLFYFIFS